MLCNQRLGHIRGKGIQSLQGMTNNNSNFDFCEHCLYGKHNRVKFLSNATRAKEIL